MISSAPPCSSATSRSKGRSARARPRWPSGSARASTRRVVLEETENPFLADFYADRPGAALQAQLFYLLNRHRQQMSLRQADLFSQITISDYLFDKDKIFAYLNLDDNELFIYQRLYDLLARDVPPPDLVSTCRRRPTCCCAASHAPAPIAEAVGARSPTTSTCAS